MKPTYYLYLIVGFFSLVIGFYSLGNEYKEKINKAKVIEFYQENKSDYKIKKLNYEKLKVYYNEEIFDKCYNGTFLSCNKFKNPSNTLNFPDKFLNEGDDGKFLLGCLIVEEWVYSDCFCKYSDIKRCEGYKK